MNSVPNKKEFFSDIAVLRSLSVVAVVFFHTYGMMYAKDHFPDTQLVYHSIYYFVNQCVLMNIAMPVFIFISGFLFYRQLSSGRYRSFREVFQKKTLHILVPYFVFGLVMMATTDNFHPLKLLNGNYWHLWFLPMIYWCFILSFTINGLWERSLTTKLTILAIFFITASFDQFLPNILGIQYITSHFCWFILGGMISTYKVQIMNIIRRYWFLIPFLLIYLGITIFLPVPYGETSWYLVLSQIAIVIFVWYTFNKICENPHIGKLLRPLVYLSKYSYGIYIFHNWIAVYLISSTAQRLFHLVDLTDHTILFPLCFFICTFILSLIVSKLLLSTKVGKFLIG